MSGRILIVDDDRYSREAVEAKLIREYFDVLSVGDGASALATARSLDPDLILLDVVLPGMDGFEICRQLKAEPSTHHIPVIMITALSEVEDRVQGLRAGADDVLSKPYDNVTLFARIRSLVRLKQTLDQWRLREETTQRMGILADRPPPPDDGSFTRVVLVDDDPEEAETIRRTLGRDKDTVAVVAQIDGAWDEVVKADAEVVVVSLSEGGTDPLRLCSQIRSMEATRPLPILLIGDDADRERLIKGLDLGVNDFMVRPIEEEELLARVRTQSRRKRYQDRLQTGFLESLSLALVDSLTGLHNRRYLSTHLEAVLERAVEAKKPLAVLMLDIDHFKAVNDRFGHAAGDAVLAEVAQRIAGGVRGFDMVARFGGEEFVVVMPATPRKIALMVAERLRTRIADEPIDLAGDESSQTVTVSVGVTMAGGTGETPAALLKRADDALYRAKAEGRNRVAIEA